MAELKDDLSQKQNIYMGWWATHKRMTIAAQAHDNIISALAQSPVTGMVASASHDNSMKLWK
ncbi:transcriptional corepressor leunig-like protein [Quercus suber]|uniref:Transcriptional corepressor leunig-like protein n=1 Tax=Quercus suber TaxID=58331 RepID=A0AAW0M9Q5_QUESU